VPVTHIAHANARNQIGIPLALHIVHINTLSALNLQSKRKITGLGEVFEKQLTLSGHGAKINLIGKMVLASSPVLRLIKG
jgi:hypothetical protein